MSYFLGISALANVLFLVLMMHGPAQPLNTSMAKLVVQQRIENLSNAEFGAYVTMGTSCAEQQSDREGIVSGRGQTERRSSTIAGVVVIKQAEFSYKAEVSNRCSRWNPNCYDVESLGFSGTTFVTPKI